MIEYKVTVLLIVNFHAILITKAIFMKTLQFLNIRYCKALVAGKQ